MKKIIKKIIYSNALFCKICARLKMVINKKQYEEFLKFMSDFYGEENMKNKKLVSKVAKEAFFCNLYYKVTFQEYFLYKFSELSNKKRKEFISRPEFIEIMDRIGENKQEYKNILDDKYKGYLKFKEYYKRDIIKINGKEDKNNFEEFCKKHDSFIVKPINSDKGKGVYRIDKKEYKSIEDIWSKILKDGDVLLEELITQADGLGRFHPKSVNTIRFALYIKEGIVTKLFAILRIGQGDSVVDNASAGGIVAKIDLKTGIIVTPGLTFNGKKYLKHPDSDVRIIGYQIPKWDELCSIAESATKLLPEYNYISWDFALTDNGWAIVEGNARGTFRIYQTFGEGIREKIEKIVK